MSTAPLMPVHQPDSFEFSAENLKKAAKIIAKYPPGRQASAVMPLLDLAQRQSDNWLPRAAMDAVAALLDMPKIKVYEVATFYTMYNKAPVGKHHIQVCTTTPCWLRGSDGVIETCRAKLGIDFDETTPDGQFSMVEVECLGACVNAPMVQINDDYFEDLTPEKTATLLDDLAAGRTPTVGSQLHRKGSCAASGNTTLLDSGADSVVNGGVTPLEGYDGIPLVLKKAGLAGLASHEPDAPAPTAISGDPIIDSAFAPEPDPAPETATTEPEPTLEPMPEPESAAISGDLIDDIFAKV